jgi:VWFA-related protein
MHMTASCRNQLGECFALRWATRMTRQSPTAATWLAAFALSVVVAVAFLRAQEPSFRASATYVEIDAFVTDRSGAAVKDLTRDDFEILEGGKPQALSTFEFVDLPIVAPPALPPPKGLIESDVTSNRQASEGRLWVILLDAPAMAPPPQTEGAVYMRLSQIVARNFIEQAVGPDDEVAVIHAQGSMSASQPPTRSRALMLRSIEKFSEGVASREPETAQEQVSMIQMTYRIIEELSAALGAASSRRKAILWIGGQTIPDPSACVPLRLTMGEAAATILARYRDAIRAAQRNNVAIYPVDPSRLSTRGGGGACVGGPGGTAIQGEIYRQSALRMVAEDTGGVALVNTNNLRDGFANIVADNSTYYLLGYYPATEHRDGKFHEFTVRVKRPAVTVRARKGYLAPDAASTERAAQRASQQSDPVVNALRSPLPNRGLTVSVFSAPFKGSAALASVVIGAHVDGATLQLTEGMQETKVNVAFQVIDAEGKTLVSRGQSHSLIASTAQQRDVLRREGLQVVDQIDLPPGRHEVRVAAHQREGSRTGSVIAYVDVPQFARERLALSGMLVETKSASAQESANQAAPADADITLTARREFSTAAAVTIRSVVYWQADVPADAIIVTASLRTAAGVPMRNLDVSTRELPEAGERRTAAVNAPLSGLAPGSYVVQLEARTTRGRRAVATREMLLHVVSP